MPVNIYVSADGSNENGDGSQERPYRTIEYIKSFVLPYIQSNMSIIIVPLTDIIEGQFTGFNQSRLVTFNTDDSGHTITFNNLVKVSNGTYIFKNCVFTQGVDIFQKAYADISNCSFNPSSNINGCIRCRYGSVATLNNIAIQADEGVQYGITSYDNSYVKLSGSLTISGDFSYLFFLSNQGSLFIVKQLTMNAVAASGKKYFLNYASVLNLNGRGDGFMGDHLTAGSKDESSIIC